MIRFGSLALACGLTSAALSAQTLDQCRGLRQHGKLAEAQTCYTRLAAGTNSYMRAEGLWALERFQEANEQFKALVKQEPKNALYRVRWGYLFLERFNPAEAGNLFNEALEIDKDNAQAYLGLARVAAENFGGIAVELAEKAAKLDPK
jgi:tetratricopeptide (TPR) repeat protein